MAFDFEQLKDILVCPESKSILVEDEQWLICVDPQCRLRYEVRDDIPIMLIDEAEELSPDDWAAVMQKHSRDPQTGLAPGDPSPEAADDGPPETPSG